jgi:RimJ/RimL family protein N-acetyltransferase
MQDSTLIEFIAVTDGNGRTEAANFLSSCEWPFHCRARLTFEQAQKILLDSDQDSRAFLISKQDRTIGLIRVLDIDDIDDGSPVIDLRVAPDQRNKGVATTVLRWLVGMLFSKYGSLVRIEATTREDNIPMQLVLVKSGFLHEGRLRKAWSSESGERMDTMVYGILRGNISHTS